ncbi:MAG TPA: helix-turn-helix domain-containing protein [Bryobacteraceae bacterium]|nr:helix-turn-helix domain-containing protein [Bryobacteraceae bacterium]
MDETPRLFDMRSIHPGKILRQIMAEKGWTQDELATITGISRQTIYMIMSGRSNVSAETAARFAAAFGNTAEEWIKWDGLYRLAALEADLDDVGKLSRLYQLAPIRDMQRRGWIEATASPQELESELTRFFGSNPLVEDISLPIAARKPVVSSTLNSAEKAWCFRARQLAASMLVEPFNADKLDRAERKLRDLAAYPREARHIAKVLSQYGIRFVVIEPLPGGRIDGATLWMDNEPIIALSIKDDRIDGFWFTLMHEFAHVRNGDASVDTDLIDGTKGIVVRLVEEEAERVANEQAANFLVPRTEMNSFIRRVGPLYSRERIIQFANRMKIHPGIIVGQLQHREEVGYSALREFLVKVRDSVTSTALTDGWNQVISPNLT